MATPFYVQPGATAPLRQGDIFKLIPRVEVPLAKMLVARDELVQETRWVDVAAEGRELVITVGVRPVFAIVITQDCDLERETHLAFAEIDKLSAVAGFPLPADTKTKSWVRLITRETRLHQKWFYLPREDSIGFSQAMAVDFKSLIRIPAGDLNAVRDPLRVAALPPVALEHFQHKVAEYFTRYAYDEWYPLDRPQFDVYEEDAKPEVVSPLPWQT